MSDILKNEASYFESLEKIKQEISQTRSHVVMSANSELIGMYWRIGHDIDAHSEWGSKYLQSLSYDIRMAFPGVKGFSVRNLKYMLKFAREFDYEEVQQLVAQIPWGHIVHLMDKVDDRHERLWYVGQTVENGWSRAVLMHQVSSALYRRQIASEKVNNFATGCCHLQIASWFSSLSKVSLSNKSKSCKHSTTAWRRIILGCRHLKFYFAIMSICFT